MVDSGFAQQPNQHGGRSTGFKALIALLVVLALAVGSLTAYAAYRFFFAPKHDDAIALVPAESFFYGSAFLEPSTPQKRAIQDLLAKTSLEDFDNASSRFRKLFDEGVDETGCTFEESIEPWLGDQLAGFVLPPEDPDGTSDGAFFVASEDDEAAIEAWTKCGEPDTDFDEDRSYKGVDYRVEDGGEVLTTIDGFLVTGSEPALKAAIDARDGQSLGDTDEYEEATADLTEDHLASFYFSPKKVLDATQDSAGLAAPNMSAFRALAGGSLDRPITGTFFARPDGLVLEYATGVPEEGPLASVVPQIVGADVVPALPEDSWGALGIGELGGYVQGILDSMETAGIPGFNQELVEEQIRNATGLDLQNDILAWMGDIGFFVRGTNVFSIDGGAVIETSDADKARGAVAVLGQFMADQGAPISSAEIGGAKGFVLKDPTIPKPINVVVGDDRLVIGYGDDATEAALSSEDALGDTEEFRTAAAGIGEGFELTGYFEVPAIVELVESQATTDTTYQEDVKPILDSLRYVAFGSRLSDDTSVTRLVLGVE